MGPLSPQQPPGPLAYVLRGGEQGAERLRLLARIKWPSTKTLLRRVGMRPGMRCLDVGCGPGAVTLKLARWVGPTGLAVGIDLDEHCLELARQDAARLGLPAQFIREEVNALREEAACDLVYSRFLLTHLPDPARAVECLVRAVRPGGLVAVEDIEFAAHFCYPACPAFDRYVSLYQQAVQRRGGDPNIGPRLASLLLDAGLQRVGVEVVQPTFRGGPGKRMAQVTLEHIRETVVTAGLAAAPEVDAVIAEPRPLSPQSADDPQSAPDSSGLGPAAFWPPLLTANLLNLTGNLGCRIREAVDKVSPDAKDHPKDVSKHRVPAWAFLERGGACRPRAGGRLLLDRLNDRLGGPGRSRFAVLVHRDQDWGYRNKRLGFRLGRRSERGSSGNQLAHDDVLRQTGQPVGLARQCCPG